MNVQLVLVRKRKRIWTGQIRHTEATLGRARDCTIRIPSSEVSRLHCRLRIENGLVTVEDLESANGTFVNDTRVQDPEVVHPGDRLRVGPVTFVVEYELPTENLRPLRGKKKREEQETIDDVEVVEEADSKPKNKKPPSTIDVEVIEDVDSEPAKKPPSTAAMEVVVEDVSPLGEEEELTLPDDGHLRDFLLELDDADKLSSGQ